MILIDNFYAALYKQSVSIGDINPPGEIQYKGYTRKLFCAIHGHSIEDITFDKSEENCVDSVTHMVTMTHKGRVNHFTLITHGKGY